MRASVRKLIERYYAALRTLERQGVSSESAIRMPGYVMISDAARARGLTLLAEQPVTTADGRRIRVDGELRDEFRLSRGVWEAKDLHDDLDAEIAKKIADGYPLKNTLFENSRRGVLYQNGVRAGEFDLRDPVALAQLLDSFLSWGEPQIRQFHAAVRSFGQEIPEVAQRLTEMIARRKAESPAVLQAVSAFYEHCQRTHNPAITKAEVDEMLVQHLMTERIFTSVFGNRDFVFRNPIAHQLEAISDTLVSAGSFTREAFLAPLDPFYAVLEETARTIDDYQEKSHFLNTVYERFFQRFSKKTADTRGINYTPGAIVEWMARSLDLTFRDLLGVELGHPGVHVLDPCSGTGTFLVEILNQLESSEVREKYAELHANEILLLPYYISALNIEHAYFARTGEYRPFEGMCFADSLDARRQQQEIFDPDNSVRLARQHEARITAVIANPPYNAGQQREGDNNRNRVYKEVKDRIRATYGRNAGATNLKALVNDPYVQFIRTYTDRLRDADGVLAFVTNNAWLDGQAFGGMRRELRREFTQIFVLDLGGNVRKNPRLSGTTHNVFGIQVGVAVTILVRARKGAPQTAPADVFYARLDEDWTRKQKLQFLVEHTDVSAVEWRQLSPDDREDWFADGSSGAFRGFRALGSRDRKKGRAAEPSVFGEYSLGVVTNRDWWVYDFDADALERRVRGFVETYNGEVARYTEANQPKAVLDDFVLSDERRIKWSRDLKDDLKRLRRATFDRARIRPAAYRPFVEKRYYFDPILSQDLFRQPRFFPAGAENVAICLTDAGAEKPFGCLAVTSVPDLHLMGPGTGTQCFPFYVYDEDGMRRENITEAALSEFRERYGEAVTRWDVFDYVYGVLHSPVYRASFAGSLRRELARVPMVAAGAFAGFVDAGRRLRILHTGFGDGERYPLGREERDPFTWRVERMRLSRDRTAIEVNDSLTLTGLPPEALAYEVGGRPAVQWVIDHVAVRRDAPSGIVHNPNPPECERAVVDLLLRVVHVAVESTRIIWGLPPLEPVP